MKICPLCEKEFGDEIQNCPDDFADLMPLITDPLIGSIIEDRYRITDVIGVGSMGVVYRAVQEAVSREVAIKVLPKELASNRQAVKRFHHEAKAASRLNHPHIITVYDFGIAAGGQPFIAMELLDGTTMDKYLLERKRLELFEALPIIQQMCEAIGEAHNQGLIHRDIKPANIALVERAGRKNHVIILDFGIAKGTERMNDPDSTAPGVVFGSPVYMSPERFLGQSGDVRSDVYSLAVVIFQMLSGVVPFKSTDLINLISSHVIAAPPSVASVTCEATIPAAMEQVVQRALSKSPNDRPQSMTEFWEEIHRACKPRTAPNLVPESVRPVDLTGNASTHDVFKRLEGLLSDAPPGATNLGAAAVAEGADAAMAEAASAPSQAQAPVQPPPAEPEAPVASPQAPVATPQLDMRPTAGAAPPRPYLNTPSTALDAVPPAKSTEQPQLVQPNEPPRQPSQSQPPGALRRDPGGRSRTYTDNDEYESNPSGRFAPASFAPSGSKSGDSSSSHGMLVMLLVVGVVIAGFAIMGIAMTQPQASPKYCQTLLSEGKLDDAGHVLALLRNDNRTADNEQLDQLSMGLAREYVRANRLPAAIQSLQQIPPASGYYEEAQILIKRYRDRIGI
jgi:serine/threonine-protein kinase